MSIIYLSSFSFSISSGVLFYGGLGGRWRESADEGHLSKSKVLLGGASLASGCGTPGVEKKGSLARHSAKSFGKGPDSFYSCTRLIEGMLSNKGSFSPHFAKLIL